MSAFVVLSDWQVPKLLAGKVRNYYNYVVEREVQADEADIIAGLSASLRTQVWSHSSCVLLVLTCWLRACILC